ncbi:ergothioneine biosynthesis protein EgtC [Pseudonocardia ailaonensis]|uniref:Gamma-glutamyl-hercynylcysteine sulfoxide hydrolase n=1 Tax=Pseudonocardia ailaonensis TaxID=367279 RepID=A0ABN2MLD2_9PSEU
MCRHLARIGPPASLAAVLLEPAHSLLHQSYAPADMRGGGTVNADGFGAGWYPDPVSGPASDPVPGAVSGPAGPTRYRSAQPIWSDASFAALAASVRTGAVLAAVRSATTGMPVVGTAAAPFAEGRWLFSHNGVVRGWPGSVAGLAARLPVTDLLTLDAPTDSAVLWALVRHRLRAGEEPGAVLAETVAEVAVAAPGSRLNLLLTDGSTIWGTAWDHALSVRVADGEAIVASEPTDEGPGWQPVPEGHLVIAAPDRVSYSAITPVAAAGPSAVGAPAASVPGPDPNPTDPRQTDPRRTDPRPTDPRAADPATRPHDPGQDLPEPRGAHR